ncbi:transmembrane protein, putative (macronuclear) [Tetrahymena thermophila SB210]|uniref:Transmembrane protein, putative n=1 Tax=Tetrahymena thermophila (strain SB210) TaxID=312017 RepID=W7XB82_TETTS|nr:transmembrane protein, putative [Tetrahymena thermophila SB210]EWS76640.1 transmembrane protein, putative [Tetrahymena thermophila SB210]|eukprot:XP_012650808.1 transmembrane protein, putative [Tetrahymena thermophila SB210]
MLTKIKILFISLQNFIIYVLVRQVFSIQTKIQFIILIISEEQQVGTFQTIIRKKYLVNIHKLFLIIYLQIQAIRQLAQHLILHFKLSLLKIIRFYMKYLLVHTQHISLVMATKYLFSAIVPFYNTMMEIQIRSYSFKTTTMGKACRTYYINKIRQYLQIAMSLLQLVQMTQIFNYNRQNKLIQKIKFNFQINLFLTQGIIK